MKMDLAGAMRAATKLTRAQKLMEATRIIQSALLLGRDRPIQAPQANRALRAALENFMIDITRMAHRLRSRVLRELAGG
jgi:hypothetical protein